MAERTCSIEGCESTHRLARGWCWKHYQRWLKWGDPLVTSYPKYPWPENLLRRLEVQPNGCVYFTGFVSKDGYGQVQKDGRQRSAHVAMWQLMVGPVPDGLVLDHLCRNRPCVNVGHLEPVTSKENNLRGESPPAVNARKTHCPEGHEYDRTILRSDGRTERKCLLCQAAAARRYRTKRTTP